MIVIDNKIISDEIKDSFFLCNLTACKGACCVQGEGGAPLSEQEAEMLPTLYEQVKPYLTDEGKHTIEQNGYSVEDADKGYQVTPLRKSDGACAYVYFDESNVACCGFEKAFLDHKTEFRKPVSCHLYPIRIQEKKGLHFINYDEWDICDPACDLGEELAVPLYQFVKEGLTRKYGNEFYESLEATINHLEESE